MKTGTELINKWLRKGCPATSGPRSLIYQQRAQKALVRPMEYFTQRLSKIGPKIVSGYGQWRSQWAKPGCPCKRVSDLELTYCSSCWQWAYTQEYVKMNPFLGRGRFQRTEEIRHCSEKAPQSTDDVHRIATYLLSHPRKEVYGWLFLILCYTGLRIGEALALRKNGNSVGSNHWEGWFSPPTLAVRRSKRPGAPLTYLKLSNAATELLEAFHAWHNGSDNYFVWVDRKPIDPSALAIYLGRACKACGIPHISPHGCRSFYCRVLRSYEDDDRKVADALGHTNPDLVQRIYGGRIHGEKLSWLPTGSVAWSPWNRSSLPSNVIAI